eukprot:136104_1
MLCCVASTVSGCAQCTHFAFLLNSITSLFVIVSHPLHCLNLSNLILYVSIDPNRLNYTFDCSVGKCNTFVSSILGKEVIKRILQQGVRLLKQEKHSFLSPQLY